MGKSVLKNMAGVKPGQQAFEKGTDYVTRPLRAILYPNLGRVGNTVRTTALAATGLNETNKVLDRTGAVADHADVMADVSALGSQRLSDFFRQYSTRGGVAKGFLRGSGLYRGLLGEPESWAKNIGDRAVYTTGMDLVRDDMSKAFNRDVKLHEYMNPATALLNRFTQQRAGKSIDQTVYGQKFKGLTDGLSLSDIKERLLG